MNWASARGSTAARAAVATALVPVEVMASLPSVQGGVEADRRVDEGEVGEGLREVADLLAREGDLLGVEPRVIAVGEHLLEGGAGIVEAPGVGERIHVGEGAEREGALRAAEPVGGRFRVV